MFQPVWERIDKEMDFHIVYVKKGQTNPKAVGNNIDNILNKLGF